MADLDRARLNLRTILTSFHAAMDSPSGPANAASIVARAMLLLDRAREHATGSTLRQEIDAVVVAVEARTPDRMDRLG